MMLEIGFMDVEYKNLTGGVAVRRWGSHCPTVPLPHFPTYSSSSFASVSFGRMRSS